MIPLEYNISVVGQANVKRALASVEQRVVEHNTRDRGQRTGAVSEVSKAERERMRAAMALDRQRSAALYKQFRAQEREALRVEKAREKAAVRTENERRRAQERADKQAQRDTQRLGRERERAAKREARVRERAARVEAAERSRFRQAVGGAIGRSARGAIGTVGRLGAGALALGGGFDLSGDIQHTTREIKGASQLAAQAGTPEIKRELLQESRGVRGFTSEEAIGGLTSFVDVTGDLDAARAILKDMGDVALATSTDIADLGGAMGSAFIPLADQIKDPTKRLEAMRSVMKAVAGMGAVGAVEVKDLASEMAGLAAASQRFGGSSEENLKIMVAMAQAARQRGGASSAAEAVTAVSRFSSDVIGTRGQKQLRSMGISAFRDEGKTQLKDPREIILDVLDKTKGDLTKVTKIFGERSVRAFSGFAPVFTAAERQEKGSGRKAVQQEFERLTNAAVTDEQIQERVASRMEDPDIRFKEAMKEFNAAVGDQLLPVIIELIPKFSEMLPNIVEATKAFADFVSFAAENPFKGIGAIIAGKLVLDLAGAGIGKIVASTLGTVIGGAAGLLGKAGAAIGVGQAAATGASAAGAAGAAGAVGIGAKIASLAGVAGMGLAKGAAVLGGAGLAAAGGVALAANQASKFSDETGGQGILGFVTGGFAGIDSEMDRRAKEEAEKRRRRKAVEEMMTTPHASELVPEPPLAGGVSPAAAAADKGAQPAEGMQEGGAKQAQADLQIGAKNAGEELARQMPAVAQAFAQALASQPVPMNRTIFPSPR